MNEIRCAWNWIDITYCKFKDTNIDYETCFR